MHRLRSSIASILATAAVAAVGLAILRLYLTQDPLYAIGVALVLGVLPMACLLAWGVALGLIALVRRHECPAFLVGFEAFGGASVIGVVTYVAAFDQQGIRLLLAVDPWIHIWHGSGPYLHTDPMIVAFFMGVYFIPQLVFALIGGALTHAFRIRLVRGPIGATTPRSERQ